MIPYIILFLLVFLLQFNIKSKKWNIYDFMLITLLIFYSGLRYGIGTDYNLYESIFNKSYDISIMPTNRTGIGFSYLCHFFIDIGLNYNHLVFFCSLITILGVYIFIKKNSSRPGLSILLYICLGFYTASFNGFRQSLSLSLLLISYVLFQKNKKMLSIVFGFISFGIHSSSLFGIILYFVIYKLRNRQISMKLLYPIFIIISLFYKYLFAKIVVMINGYEGYLDYNSIPGIGTYIIVAFYFIVTVLLILPHRKGLEEKNKFNRQCINMLIIGNCLMLLQIHNWLFTRLVLYTTIFVPITLSDYYELVNIKSKKEYSLVFYTIIFIYFIIYVNSFGGVVPYRTILFN